MDVPCPGKRVNHRAWCTRANSDPLQPPTRAVPVLYRVVLPALPPRARTPAGVHSTHYHTRNTMGRGSKKKQGEAGSSAVAAAAAAAQAVAAAAVAGPDEPVWRLLLGDLWQAPDAQLVCRLLCCSRAMARLVHELCAGRVVASASSQEQSYSPPWQQQVTARGEAYRAWLTKHAPLLAELRLELWDSQDESVAAGLQAAAQPQPLPLRSLSLSTSSSIGGVRSNASSMPLPSLVAVCPRLTQLQLEGCVLAEGQQQLATALTALHQLRELSMELPQPVTVPALQLGSLQLTMLRLSRVQLSAEAFRSLPASLVDLQYRPDCGPALPHAGHLTALTRLDCRSLDASSSVPPSVQQLKLGWCSNPASLHHLTRLRSLDCGVTMCGLEQWQAAVSAIGPSLTALDMRASSQGGALRSALLWQRASGPNLPLTGLTVIGVRTSVAHLGQWTGLTRLELSYVEPTETPQQVAQQLQQLTALRDLVLRLYFRGRNEPSPLQPLVDGVDGMSSLRSLMFRDELSAQQRAQLCGMTQLTALSFRVDEG